jgi:hypothetical protein
MNKKEASLKRSQEELRLDPMFYKRKGALGGSVKGVKKGTAGMSPEKRKEVSAKGVAARKARRDEALKAE